MTYEQQPHSHLGDVLKTQAEAAEAGGVSDSLGIEGIETTPLYIRELHGEFTLPELPSDPEVPEALRELESEAARKTRLTGIWTSVAVEVENPLNVPKREIVEYIAKTHDRRSA